MLATGTDSRITNAAILGKRTLGPERTHNYVCANALEYQMVPSLNPKGSANVARHGYLPFAGDFGPRPHGRPFFLTLSRILYSTKGLASLVSLNSRIWRLIYQTANLGYEFQDE
jgi:hypothetical protein